ncbi:hypothetical protein FRX31_022984 [Thalictrum thalictroides]|uniref:Uncharacterized protein n=1 Tax=Thalictrum thalictroides TaxID=46969 RepID=A0A7J6VRE0_THATH|nr:hypothetical protein FRX31_022984 [Thalictrum thalictroides]
METEIARREKSSKRLLFDRRYGWVYDEWKDPSEEALAGARGMFCILPLANALVKTASKSINDATSLAAKVLERPDEFSPQALQSSLNHRFQEFMSLLQKPNINLVNSKVNSSILSTSCSEHLERNNSHDC